MSADADINQAEVPREENARSEPQKRSELRHLLGLWPFLKPYRKTMGLAVVALLMAAGASLMLPIGVRLVIDEGFSADQASAIDQQFLALSAIVAVLALFSSLRYYLVTWLGERVVADVRNAVYRHVLSLSPTFFEVTRTGEVLSRLTTDTTLVQSIAGVNLSITLRSLLTFTGGLVLLAFTSPKLTGIAMLLIPLVLIPLIVYGRRVRRLTRDAQDKVALASGVAGETLNALPMVQAFSLESLQALRFKGAVEESFDKAVQRLRARAALTAFAILVVFGAIVFVLWLGAKSVIAGTMSPGELGQFLLYAIFVAGSAASLSEMWGEIQRAAGAVQRIMELLNARPDIIAPADPIPIAEPARGEIRFENVDFSYPSRPGQRALGRFSLTVSPGETVALPSPIFEPQLPTVAIGCFEIGISTTVINEWV